MTAQPAACRPAPLAAPPPPADAPVLAGRPLRPGADPSRQPRFGDAVWDLSGAGMLPNRTAWAYTIDFRTIADPGRRLAAKEFLYSRLTRRLGGKRGSAKALTVVGDFRGLKAFFDYLDRECDGLALAGVTQAVLDAYLASVRAGRAVKPNSLRHYVDPLVRLYKHSPYLSHDRLTIHPWRGRAVRTVVGDCAAPGENRTPRIPEVVMGPLLKAALFYVRVAAPDILAAASECRQLAAAVGGGGCQRPGERLAAFIARRRAAGRGLPLLDDTLARGAGKTPRAEGGAVNGRLVELLAGVAPNARKAPPIRAMVDAAVAELGLEPGGFDTPIGPHPDTGCPWRERFSPTSLAKEKWHLLAACYIVVAYLSGMRDSEVQSLRRGCHYTERSADGVLVRHKVRGTVYKARGSQGAEATWVVIEPVAEAIAVLERLTDSTWLFAKPSLVKSMPRLGKAVNDHLDRFRAHAATAGYPVPAVDGADWHLTSGQFRRTLAWHLANRPFGTIAGKIQYQHLRVASFEGYGGTSASGFTAEVAAERELARLEDIVERYEDYKAGVRFAGPGAARVTAEFRRIREELGDFPGLIADERRLRVLLEHLARTLYPAVLNDCYFAPETALCLARAGGAGREAPLVNACSPSRCANSCVTGRHLPVWARARDDAAALLARPRLSPLQQAALTDEVARMDAVIAAVGRGTDEGE